MTGPRSVNREEVTGTSRRRWRPKGVMLLLQEGATVSWDPATTCWSSSTSSYEILITLPIILVESYVYWRQLKWVIARLAGLRGWRRTQYWLPTVMIAGPTLAILASGNGCGTDLVRDVAGTICVFANWPALVGILGAAAFLSGTGVEEGWPAGIGIAAAAWATWYALVVWLEGRVEEETLVRLKLG